MPVYQTDHHHSSALQGSTSLFGRHSWDDHFLCSFWSLLIVFIILIIILVIAEMIFSDLFLIDIIIHQIHHHQNLKAKLINTHDSNFSSLYSSSSSSSWSYSSSSSSLSSSSWLEATSTGSFELTVWTNVNCPGPLCSTSSWNPIPIPIHQNVQISTEFKF